MKNKIELFFSFLLVPLDYLMLLLAGISAYYLRFSDYYIDIRPVIFDLPFSEYFQALLGVALIWLIVFTIAGLYQVGGLGRLVREISRIFLACFSGLAVLSIIIFFQRELFDSRFIVLVGFVLAFFYVSLARIFIRWLKRYLFKFGVGVHNVVLVGESQSSEKLKDEFRNNKKQGFKVVKQLTDFSLETSQELAEFIKQERVDEVIQSDPNLSKVETLRLYDFASENHLGFRYVADLLEIKVLRSEVIEIIGIPVVEVKKTTLDGWGRIIKRLFDIIVSSILILILSPILIITAMLIKIDSRGPIFFSRKDDGSPLLRVGEGGRTFRYFKFRSMIPGADSMRYRELANQNIRHDGPLVKIKNDPRITRFGRFIRRFSIDELPELFLVFMGKMSLVGPRPHLPEEVAKYEKHHKKTLTIKPGITGLAQISGRSDLLFEEEVKLDLYYIENWSMLLDFSILFKTPLAVLKNRQTE
jgi:exopolysaccharide biosynthesis polyprenyl glycosylphosphotransferase